MTWEMCGGLQVQSSLKPLQLVSLVSGHASCANHLLSQDEQADETSETAWESLHVPTCLLSLRYSLPRRVTCE